MSWNSIWKSETAEGCVIQQENVVLCETLMFGLTGEESRLLVASMRVYQKSVKVINASRYTFWGAVAVLAVSFFPRIEWLAGYRWHLGLMALSSFFCLLLITPVLENAIDRLQEVTDRAMGRRGLPPYDIRA